MRPSCCFSKIRSENDAAGTRRGHSFFKMISSVIDIGSNSIKLLVAEGEAARPLFETIRETRLSPDAESARERIPDAAFAAGIRAVSELASLARTYSPVSSAIVGTSLFRTAENAREFADAVENATGTPMRILSGEEEAELVAAGVASDPAAQTPCAIFDLGGGSLEFIAKTDVPAPIFVRSWALGAVRMTRRFFRAPKEKIPPQEISVLRKFVRETLGDAFPEKIPPRAQAVFCGGAAGLCARLTGGKTSLPASALETFLGEFSAKNFDERVAAGVPAQRADIFPAALATLAEVCALGGFSSFVCSRRNLRYGLCARLNSPAAAPKKI